MNESLRRPGPERLAVTSPLAFGGDSVDALAAARRHGLPFVPRSGRSLPVLAADCDADAVLVVGPRRASLWLDGAEHAWNAGMGDLRLRRLERGDQATRDRFLESVALRPGDEVLDATLGLGMDALVAASVVGATGRVVGIEVSSALAALTAEGLARHPADAARRIEVIRGDAGDELRKLPARSFDVVVFDPMFRHARAGARTFDIVRRLASAAPLTAEMLDRARQVARRHVVVKDGTPGWDLARLGLSPLPSARGAKTLHARVAALGATAPL